MTHKLDPADATRPLSAGPTPDAPPLGPTADRDTVLVLKHPGESDPGNLLAWLHANDYPVRVARVMGGLPRASSFRAVVVLGSPAAVYDADLAWIEHERHFVRQCISLGTPVLGICFGAQLLAETLGGQVRALAEPELGWQIFQGQEPYAAEWFSWHGDEILPPEDAQTLASSRKCVQAFRQGSHVGVQFHPEMTPEILERWLSLEEMTQRLLDHGISPQRTRARTDERSDEALSDAHNLYANFFDNSGSPGTVVHDQTADPDHPTAGRLTPRGRTVTLAPAEPSQIGAP